MRVFDCLKSIPLKSSDFYLKIIAFTYFIAIFSFLFFQNFVLTDNFEILNLRSSDAFGFHVELQKLHQYLCHGEFKKILKESYFYGYGFIFWIFLALATLPFYLFGTEQEIIITTFEICLIFQMLCVIILYKISALYTKNEKVKLFICFLTSLFGVFAFFGLSFYTITPLAFFELLTFYFAARIENLPTKKDLILVALAFATAVGIKITGLLIAPLICLILLDRYKWNFNKKNLIDAAFFTAIFIAASLIFFHPYGDYKNVIKTISAYSNMTTSSSGDIKNDSLLYMFNEGIVKNILPLASLIMMSGLFIFRIFLDLKHQRNRRFDFLFIIANSLFAAIFCLLVIKRSPLIISNYLFGFAFLFLLSLTALEYYKKYKPLQKIAVATSLAIILISIYCRGDILNSYNYIYHLENENKNKLTEISEIKVS